AAQLKATAVGVGYAAGSVRHHDQLLRVVKDAGVEIALALQLRLIFFLLGDVEDETAVLDNISTCIAHGESVLQSVDQTAVFAAQSFFEVADHALFRKCCFEPLALRRLGINVAQNVGL